MIKLSATKIAACSDMLSEKPAIRCADFELPVFQQMPQPASHLPGSGPPGKSRLPQPRQGRRQLRRLHRRLSSGGFRGQRGRQRRRLGSRGGGIFVWHKNHTVRARLAALDPWMN